MIQGKMSPYFLNGISLTNGLEHIEIFIVFSRQKLHFHKSFHHSLYLKPSITLKLPHLSNINQLLMIIVQQ